MLEEGDSALTEERATLDRVSTLGEAMGWRESFLEESCLEESSALGMALDEDEEVSVVEGSVSDDSPIGVRSGGGAASFAVRLEDEVRGERGERGEWGRGFELGGSNSPVPPLRRVSIGDDTGEVSLVSKELIVGMGAVDAVFEGRIWPEVDRLSPEGTGEFPTQVNHTTRAVILSVVPMRSARFTKFLATLCFTESFRTKSTAS